MAKQAYFAASHFSIAPGQQYKIPIKIRGGDGGMHNLDIIYDPGDDVTLLTASTAQRLGLDPNAMPGRTFPVSGINAQPQPFKEIQNLIQIGDLTPIWVPMGIAFEEGSLVENLLGRKGIMDSGLYQIIQDETGITFQEKSGPVAMLANAGGRIAQPLRSMFRQQLRTW